MQAGHGTPQFQVAFAALLVALAHADGRYAATEQRAIGSLLARRLRLTAEGADRLLEAAERSFAAARHFDDLVKHFRDVSGPADSVLLLSLAQDVAAADGTIDPRERALLGRLAAALGLPDLGGSQAAADEAPAC